MTQLLNTDGAWIAIGISVFFVVVGLLMKRVFVNILKQNAPTGSAPLPPLESPKND